MTTRKMSLRRVILPALSALAMLILALVGGCCPPAPACPTTPAIISPRPTPIPWTTPVPNDMRRDFAWFDTLGYPDLTGRTYVKVATGRWWLRDDAPVIHYVYGFLIEDSGEEFTVLTTDLFLLTYVKTLPNTVEYERVGYETLELGNEVAQYLNYLVRVEAGEKVEEKIRPFSVQMGETAELFVLARACAANGMEDLAYNVYTFTAPQYRQASRGTRNIQERIAETMIWRNVLAFEDTSISRQTLLERFDRFVKQFPESEHTAHAGDTARILRQMVEEDKTHTKPPNIETLNEEKRIAELIFQLRDQNGHQMGQPGICDIFNDERGAASPAHQLVKIGYPAIPQLIEALEDERFTRSVEYHRDFYFSHYALTVGDAALDIIEEISGRNFNTLYYTGAKMVWENRDALIKAEIEAWWREFQKKGEKQLLIEAVEVGDDNSGSQAQLLVERYPEAAPEAIAGGLRNAKNEWVHRSLVSAAAALQEEEIVPLLRSVVREESFLPSRIVAAEALYQRGYPEGLEAMINEWANPGEGNLNNTYPYDDLIQFLFGVGDPQVVEEVEKNLHKWPPAIRSEVFRRLWHNRAFGAKTDNESLAWAAAVESLLIGELDDSEELTDWYMGWDEKSSYSSRLCDLAGHELAHRWPERYEFDIEASLSERDTQIVAMKNVWRQAHGLEALPLPQRPAIPRVPDETVQPLLDRIVQTGDQKAIRAIEALGLGALPAVKARLAGLAENHPARLPLATLAANLANVIREVVITPDSVAPDRATRKYVESFEGKMLTSPMMVEALFHILRKTPRGATGVKIRADRDGDDTGVVLSLSLSKTQESENCYHQVCWVTAELVAVDTEARYRSYEDWDNTDVPSEKDYTQFTETLDEALAAAPDRTLTLRVSIDQQQSLASDETTYRPTLLIAIPAAAIALLLAFWLWRRRRRQVPQDAGEGSGEPVDPIVE